MQNLLAAGRALALTLTLGEDGNHRRVVSRRGRGSDLHWALCLLRGVQTVGKGGGRETMRRQVQWSRQGVRGRQWDGRRGRRIFGRFDQGLQAVLFQ